MRIEYLEAPTDEPAGYSDEARAKALEAEEAVERDWNDLEDAVLDFTKKHGLGAALRCFGRAVDRQKDLFK